MTASEIRALFSVATRPEIVSLAGGSPYTAGLPFDVLQQVADDVLRNEGPTALQYGGGQGDALLRERLTGVMAWEGINCRGDDVVVTQGSQQALDLLGRMFLDPDDIVIAEAPSYVGALSAFSQYRAEVRHVALDEDGLIPEAFEEAMQRVAREGRRAKFLYVVPNYHNPAGVTLCESRRDQVLEIAARHDLLVIEDNPYGLLGFDSEPLAALRARNPEVVYLGTLSKILGPGLRIGWVLLPPALRDRLVTVKEAADLCSSNFTQAVARRYLETPMFSETLKGLRETYRERRDAMLEALSEDFSGAATWTRPNGGFFVWLSLPQGLDTRVMLAKAIASRVAYVPGGAFYADEQGANCMRLSYSFPPAARVREGVRRLAGVVNEEIELAFALRGTPTPRAQSRRTPPGSPPSAATP